MINRQTNNKKEQMITLRNPNGLVARFSTYGARWLDMFVPDRNGCFEDILSEQIHCFPCWSCSTVI